jgi:hypothetical protein
MSGVRPSSATGLGRARHVLTIFSIDGPCPLKQHHWTSTHQTRHRHQRDCEWKGQVVPFGLLSNGPLALSTR